MKAIVQKCIWCIISSDINKKEKDNVFISTNEV